MEKLEIMDQELSAVSAKKKGLSKGMIALAVIAASSSAFATTTTAAGSTGFATGTDSFGDLLQTFITWLQGNLGKLLALLGFIGTFIIYLMTHKGSVLFVGIVISLIAGGMVGIVGTFFNAGATAFQLN